MILGGLFVMETMSVILQVISFRGFGRRIFRMSPIHHHFELLGWPEFTVIVRFWIIAGLCVAVGLGLFYADFIAPGRAGLTRRRFAGERVVVVGAGVAGAAAATALLAEGAARARHRAAPTPSRARARRAARRRRRSCERAATIRAHLDGATLVVAGPGVPNTAPIAGVGAGGGSPCGARWSSGHGSRGCRTWPSPGRTARPR